MSAQFKLCDYQRQALNALQTAQAMDDYAREIGCEVNFDSISCTEAQSKLLQEKWNQLNQKESP